MNPFQQTIIFSIYRCWLLAVYHIPLHTVSKQRSFLVDTSVPHVVRVARIVRISIRRRRVIGLRSDITRAIGYARPPHVPHAASFDRRFRQIILRGHVVAAGTHRKFLSAAIFAVCFEIRRSVIVRVVWCHVSG